MPTLVKFLFALAAAFVLSVCAGTACVVRTFGTSYGGFGTDDVEARREESHALTLGAGGRLDVEIPHGGVRVTTASATAKPEVRAVIRTWAKDGETARANLDGIRLVVTSSASEATLRLDRDEALRTKPASADLEIVVPARVALRLVSSSGSLSARGQFGAAQLKSSHGSIDVHGVRGDLEAISSSGSIDAADIEGAKCRLESSHGSISLANARSDAVLVDSSSGSLKARGVRGARLDLDTSHGSIELADLEGELTAKSSSGSIVASALKGKKLALESSHGSIRSSGTEGALAVTCASGQVQIDAHKGALAVKATHGSIRADGIFPALDVNSASGSIEVVARPGSALESDWKLRSGHGSVALDLPPASAFTLDARSSHGSVDVAFDVLVPAGSGSKKGVVVGAVNGGGRSLNVSTASGSVRIRPGG